MGNYNQKNNVRQKTRVFFSHFGFFKTLNMFNLRSPQDLLLTNRD